MPEQKYWLAPVPAKCEISGCEFNGVMYDAKIPGGGWANIAFETFTRLGCSLGVGRGQKYRKQDDGRWLCVAGSPEAATLEDVA